LAGQAELDQAEKLYQAGDWEKASQAYKTEAAGEPERLPAAFFYNYGTVLAKAGSFGPAYIALLRAAYLQPFDADTKFNLQQVEQRIPAAVRAIQPASWYSWWPASLRALPWQGWLIAALLFSGLALLRLPSRPARLGCTAVSCALLLTVGFSRWEARAHVYGVVALAKVKSGPAFTFSDITELEPGSLVSRETTRDGWIKIRFFRGDAVSETVGWVEPGKVLEVR
jgi:hypothetical protein